MIFDRISILSSYGALKAAQNNEGKISHILFNRTAFYGTKTNIRFKSVQELAVYIQNEFSFQIFDPNCVCGTCNESIWKLLSFVVELPGRRYITFVNNLRGGFESAEGAILNKKTIDIIAKDFAKDRRLGLIKDNYECHGYIQNQGRYVTPCEYVDMITNSYYDELIKEYMKTRNLFGLSKSEIFIDKCHEGELVKKKQWATTTEATTTQLPTTTVSTYNAQTLFLNYAMGTSVVGNGMQETNGILDGKPVTHSITIRKSGGKFFNLNELNFTVSGTISNTPIQLYPDGSTGALLGQSYNIFLLNGEIVVAWTHVIQTEDMNISINITGGTPAS
jgi:hypothetical protein